jgi:membrane protease YdiL (CAAX protease family)
MREERPAAPLEGPTEPTSRSTSTSPWPLAALCAAAGALAVPPHLAATPISAAIAVAGGLLGRHAAVWAGLPRQDQGSAGRRLGKIVRAVAAAVSGLGVGLLSLAVMRLALAPTIPAIGARLEQAGARPLGQRAATVFVASVGEEVAFRLLLLSVLAGLLARLFRRPGGVPTRRVLGAANALAALAFGAAHLPAWGAAVALSPGIVLAVLALNGFGGLVFGHLFTRYGIAAAIWSHAGADAAIQLVGPLLPTG